MSSSDWPWLWVLQDSAHEEYFWPKYAFKTIYINWKHFLGEEGHAPRLPYVLHAYACDFGRTTSKKLATACTIICLFNILLPYCWAKTSSRRNSRLNSSRLNERRGNRSRLSKYKATSIWSYPSFLHDEGGQVIRTIGLRQPFTKSLP